MRFTKAAAIVIAVLVAVLIAHPYLLAVPNRIGEWQFLAQHTGATAEYGALVVGTNDVAVSYPHFVTICASAGTTYDLRFDKMGRLKDWTSTPYGDFC